MPNNFYGNMLAANIPSMMGSVFYVDPANGLDTYDGKTPARAFKSLTTGEDALTANNNDMLVLIGDQTATASLTETLDWNKNYTHLVGACSPVHVGQRARIFGDASCSAVSPLFKVSASGCSFRNIYVNYGVGVNTNFAAVEVTGNRNYFDNCHFTGINNATQDVTGACSLKLTGGTENRYVHCSIGSITQNTRGANSSEIFVTESTSSQLFEDCYIYAWISHANHSLIRNGTDIVSMTGNWIFKNCLFQSMYLNNGTAMAEAFKIVGAPGTCYIILDHCVGVHISAWSGGHGKVYVGSLPAAATTDGLAENL